MRKYTALILSIIILFVSNGYFLYFKYLQHNIQQEIKQEIRRGVNEKGLSLIVVPLNNEKEILWTKNNKEFKYRGEMYDIVKTKIEGQKKYYYCINDIKEGLLIARLLRSSRRNNTLLRVRKTLPYKYLPEKISLKIVIISSEINFIENKQFYKSEIIDIASPPPKINIFS